MKPFPLCWVESTSEVCETDEKVTNSKTVPFLDKLSERTDVLYEPAKIIKTKVTLDKYPSFSKIHFPLNKEIKCSLKPSWASHIRIRWGWQMDECISFHNHRMPGKSCLTLFHSHSWLRETVNDYRMRQVVTGAWLGPQCPQYWLASQWHPTVPACWRSWEIWALLSVGIGTNCERWIS